MPRRDPEKLARARALRASMSSSEHAFWRIVRAHRLEGIKFARQVECGPFYIDFAQRQGRLAIELDGESHVGKEGEDAVRTRYLERKGWRVIRFTNDELANNPDGVADAILLALDKSL
jgi:very-short-patch-repair endonuclease